MTDNPFLFPKLAKGYTISLSTTLSPSRTFSQSTKPTTTLESPLLPIPSGISPSIFLGEESPRPPYSGVPWSLCTDGKSLKPQRTVNLDDKTMACIDQLIEERQSSYRTPRNKNKTVYMRGDSVDISAQTREQKIIGKVENLKKFKGLEKGTKEQQFENKLEIFDQVKTFVDTRKLFAEPEESPGALSQQTFTTAIRVLEPQTSRESYQASSRESRNTQYFGSSESPVNTGKKATFYAPSIFRSGTEDASVIAPTETISEADRKTLEIRVLYQQLKEDTIQKFGPGIFETAQKKLRNPEQFKRLDQKQKDEIKRMRKLQEELGNLDLGRKLMNNLLQKNPGSANNIQDEVFNKFDNYVKNEIKAEEPDSLTARPKRPPKDFLFFETRRTETSDLADEKKGFYQTEPDDPQIQLLKKIQHHKQKSQEVLKALKDKISHLQKKEVTKTEESASPTSRIGISPRKLKASHLGNIFGHKRDIVVPSIMLRQVQAEIEEKELLSPQTTRTKDATSKVFLWKNASTPHLRLETDFNPSATETDLYDKESPTGMYKKKGRTLSIATKDLQLISNKKKDKSMSAVALQKNKLMGIWSDLESLAATSKNLNKQVEASIKEMASSYSKKSNMMKKDDIPESLKKSVPKNHGKSSSKLAADLALKLYKSSSLSMLMHQNVDSSYRITDQ